MSNFAGTAIYYNRYRPSIPSEVAEYLIFEANRYAPATRLLDLGSGTGQVVEALYHNFNEIIAVDSDAEMLNIAEKKLRLIVSEETTISFYNCRAEEFLAPINWTASLVTICRAFHWMDQEKILKHLSNCISSTGAVAILGDRSFWQADTPWKKAVRKVIQDFLGEKRRAGKGVFSHHDRPYSEILKESPFSNVTEFTIPVCRTWNTESIIGYLYSTSFAARTLFGKKIDEFEYKIKIALAEFSKDDIFYEENKFITLIGRKS